MQRNSTWKRQPPFLFTALPQARERQAAFPTILRLPEQGGRYVEIPLGPHPLPTLGRLVLVPQSRGAF